MQAEAAAVYEAGEACAEAHEPFLEAEPVDDDPVNHPNHYVGSVECIDAIEAAVADLDGFGGFCAGNAIKYIWRHHRKGAPLVDLEKAEFYLRRLIDREVQGESEKLQ